MARPSYSQGMANVKSLTFTVAQLGALVAFAAGILKFRAPENGTIVGVTVNIAAKGGTHVTSALLVKNAGNTVATVDVDAAVAGTPVDVEGASLANTVMAKDATLSVELTEAGGTAPTWQGATVQIDYIAA